MKCMGWVNYYGIYLYLPVVFESEGYAVELWTCIEEVLIIVLIK